MTIKEALQELLISAGSAKDFIVAETPEVVQQLLLWKATFSSIWWLLTLGILIFCSYKFLKNMYLYVDSDLSAGELKELRSLEAKGYSNRTVREDSRVADLAQNTTYSRTEEEENTRIFSIGSLYWCIGIIPSTILLFVNLTWLKILIAPKFYLVEYAARLVSS